MITGDGRRASDGPGATDAGSAAGATNAHGEAGKTDAAPLTGWQKLGGAIFRARSATPIIIIFVVLLWPTPGGLSLWRGAVALALLAAGEWYRFRAVGVAGKCTRTRGRNVKELVTSGPFARVRNPLYVGNFALAYGLVVLSKVDWLLWAFPLAFSFQYAAIVAWEERVLLDRFGESYERYRSEVPAWIPSARAYSNPSGHCFRGKIAWESERNSLRALAILIAVLALKHLFFHGAMAALTNR